MSQPALMPKSEMLIRSTRCFMLGWWSLIPLFGVVPALLAFSQYSAVTRGSGSRWNAARYRLLAGTWLAAIGLLLTAFLAAAVALTIINHSINAPSHGGGYQYTD